MPVEPKYQVVVNHEEQYSIWPTARGTPPSGWQAVGKEGTETECLDHIEQVWTDIRPLSLRRAMDEAAKSPDAAADPLPEWPSGPSLVDRLSQGEHAISLVMRPEATLDRFWEAANGGRVNVLFTGTQGGTELTIALDPDALPEEGRDTVRIVGRVTLDYEPVTCRATIDLRTFSGTGRLERTAV